MSTAGTPTRWVRRDAATTEPATNDAAVAEAPTPRGRAHVRHPLVATLLAARDIVGPDATRRFLQPTLNDLHDPADLHGCPRAARRIAQAIQDRQPIVIYGDYDVDGVTASAILYHTLKRAGADVHTYVPHRLDEGYGLNEEAIRSICSMFDVRCSTEPDNETAKVGRDSSHIAHRTSHIPLVISVDCGITATGPARVARELGVDLIITDHHQFDPEDLPDAHTLVHPALSMSDVRCPMFDGELEGQDAASTSDVAARTSNIAHRTYPNLDLCGAGVAYKLAWQVAREHCGCVDALGRGKGKLPAAYRALLLDLLALAALGTVADVVPLVGENRVITCFGLSRIKQTDIAGLNALITASKLDAEMIDSYHVGFVLGPRLNACGRMGHAREAVELLTVAQGERAAELAEQLHLTNEDRRATERRIVDAAVKQVEEQGYAGDDRRAVVVAGEGWHPGVVGIVASRLVDRYHRPAVVLGIDAETGEAKGSARSIDGVSIHAAMSACAHHLTKFGGHDMAAGLTLAASSIDAFRDRLVAEVNNMLAVDDLCASVRIDADVPLGDCNVMLFDEVQRLAPFGRSNPKPRLLAEGLTLSRPAQRMGAAGKHLSLFLRQGDASIRAVAWNKGDLAEDLPAGVKVDIVFQPSINTWQGRRSAEMHIVDLRVV